MNYDENLQIHYLIIKDYDWADCRRIKYRICPNQLPWWKRNFIFNPWQAVFYTDVSGRPHKYFSREEFQRVLKPKRTLKEIHEYLAEQVRLHELYSDDVW